MLNYLQIKTATNLGYNSNDDTLNIIKTCAQKWGYIRALPLLILLIVTKKHPPPTPLVDASTNYAHPSGDILLGSLMVCST